MFSGYTIIAYSLIAVLLLCNHTHVDLCSATDCCHQALLAVQVYVSNSEEHFRICVGFSLSLSLSWRYSPVSIFKRNNNTLFQFFRLCVYLAIVKSSLFTTALAHISAMLILFLTWVNHRGLRLSTAMAEHKLNSKLLSNTHVHNNSVAWRWLTNGI